MLREAIERCLATMRGNVPFGFIPTATHCRKRHARHAQRRSENAEVKRGGDYADGG